MSTGYYVSRPHMPFVVWLLGGAILATFLLTGQYDPEHHQDILNQLAFVPAFYDVSGGYPDWSQAVAPLFGHVFVHLGIPHILMNMLAYFQASPFVARRMGGARFLVLFFASAIGGALLFYLINPHDQGGMVGASGAICGVFGAYFLAAAPTPQAALADPQIRNSMLTFLGINVVLMAMLRLPIAWQAHLGGFIAGALVYLVLAPRHRAGPWG